MAQESATGPASRVEAKENLVFLTSGAKEKLAKTTVGASETAYKMMHPFSKEARDQATEKAKTLKQEIEQKQANIRSAAHQQAEEERIRNTNPMTLAETPLTPQPEAVGGQGTNVPPHMAPSPAQPSEVQNMYASGLPGDSNQSGWNSDGSRRAGLVRTSVQHELQQHLLALQGVSLILSSLKVSLTVPLGAPTLDL
ncbi:hypothetical protein R1sor_020754 [Riccia sorocarpa]|uniref:Uncharacterized protein n=1 Tax=Riccia sorocarpa TaxID=122646 RepID=A0ABD3GFU6_9MARC